jgi:hypothetical protein
MTFLGEDSGLLSLRVAVKVGRSSPVGFALPAARGHHGPIILPSDSTVLAHVLSVLNARHDYGLDLFLLSIDEGITGYRDDSLDVRDLAVSALSLRSTCVFYPYAPRSLSCSAFGATATSTRSPCALSAIRNCTGGRWMRSLLQWGRGTTARSAEFSGGG